MTLALTESRPLRLATVTAMYVAQGIQIGLLVVAFPGYLAAHDVSPLVIGGLISALILPWTLKVFYAPLMERYTVLSMGRRRPWMLLGTTGGALGYVAMALVPDPLAHLGLLTALLVAGSLFLALQDVSTDALTIDIVPLDEQARANGLMWGGKVLSTACTAFVASRLLDSVGVSATLGIAAAATFAFTLIPLLVRERPGERMLPWTAGEASPAAEALQLGGWAEIGRSLRRVAFLPAAVLVAAAGFVISIAQGFLEAYGPVFTVQHLGWEHTAFSSAAAMATLVGGVVGMVGGGLLVTWLGRTRAIRVALLVLAAVGASMGLAAPLWTVPGVVQAFLILSVTALTLAMIAFFATCMALCWKPVAAVQFALFMAISNLGLTAGAALMGPLVAVLTPSQVLLTMAIVPVMGAGLLLRVDVEAHVARLGALDTSLALPAEARSVLDPAAA